MSIAVKTDKHEHVGIPKFGEKELSWNLAPTTKNNPEVLMKKNKGASVDLASRSRNVRLTFTLEFFHHTVMIQLYAIVTYVFWTHATLNSDIKW